MKTLDELYNLFCEHKSKEQGKQILESSYYNVRNFIQFSKEECYCDYFSQEVFNDWCNRKSTEEEVTHKSRIMALRQFLIFIKRHVGVDISFPEDMTGIKPHAKFGFQRDNPILETPISKYIDDYIKWLKSIGKYRFLDHDTLIRFNKEYAKRYPEAKELTSQMVATIFAKRPNEKASSCNQRNKPVRMFLEYANFKKHIDVEIPFPLECKRKHDRIPHAFTDKELSEFFKKIDTLPPTIYEDDLEWKFRRMQIATLYRLLYSTGMRTNEARELKRENVDFENGVINIEKTKGYHEHRIALHPSLTALLIRYDKEMDKIMPNRELFFPDNDGGCHRIVWQADIFRQVWKSISEEDARSYDLRSNYAVRNINGWKIGEPKWIDKFMYLSRSMGHSHLSSTAGYYHLVPMFREKIQNQSGKNLERLLPDMNDFLDDSLDDDLEDLK